MLENMNVNVMMNTTLDSVDASKQTLSYTSSNGETKTVDFDYLFAHPNNQKNSLYEGNSLSKNGI